MKTPIVDFVRRYQESGMVRFHMPGHKGAGFLGCEGFDITEVSGADELYEAEGIIAESERNAASLFGAGRTFYSTEGSSQCIRAMLRLAMLRQTGGTPLILAARNVHKRLRQVEYRTQSPDHPILWAADDSYYLKFYIFQVCDEK